MYSLVVLEIKVASFFGAQRESQLQASLLGSGGGGGQSLVFLGLERHLSSLCLHLHTAPPLCVSGSSYDPLRGVPATGLGPTLSWNDLILANYICENSISRQQTSCSNVLGGHEVFNLGRPLPASTLTAFSPVGLLVYFGAPYGCAFTRPTGRRNPTQRKEDV